MTGAAHPNGRKVMIEWSIWTGKTGRFQKKTGSFGCSAVHGLDTPVYTGFSVARSPPITRWDPNVLMEKGVETERPTHSR